MPGGDDGEKKEETAESREEAKEQVNIADGGQSTYPEDILVEELSHQERLRQQAIKDKEKERTQFYQKQREEAKVERSKIREKVFHSRH